MGNIQNQKPLIMKNETVEKALRAIAAKNGILRPEDVVEEARNPKHVLHSRFTWDNTEAAEQWRLMEARTLIRVTVQVMGDGVEAPVFVSLTPDRVQRGGGYRVMSEVMADAAMRDQLLKDALAELNAFTRKYRELRQLAEVFSAIKKVKKAA